MGLVVAAIPEAGDSSALEAIEEDPNLEIVVDVERKRVVAPAIDLDIAFEARMTSRSTGLLHGLDDVGLSLRHTDAIPSVRVRRGRLAAVGPGLAPRGSGGGSYASAI